MYRGIRSWEKDGTEEMSLNVLNTLGPILLGPLKAPIETHYLQSSGDLAKVSSTRVREGEAPLPPSAPLPAFFLAASAFLASFSFSSFSSFSFSTSRMRVSQRRASSWGVRLLKNQSKRKSQDLRISALSSSHCPYLRKCLVFRV